MYQLVGKCNDVANWQNDTFLLFDSTRNTQLLCISSDGNDDKGNCSMMSVVDICQNIGIFHCFSAHVHTILCYDVKSVKAQLCILHVLLCDIIRRGITIYLHPSFLRCLRGDR